MLHVEAANRELLEEARNGTLTGERISQLDDQGATAFLKAFQAATAASHIECVQALLESHKVDATESDDLGYTALHKAKQPHIAKLLLEHGANPGAPNLHARYTPLHFAVMSQNDELVLCMLEYNADVNCSTIHGVTPLHQAQSSTVANALLDGGADVNAITREHQQTPLHWAVIHQNEEVVRCLLAAGADTSIRDKQGKTPGDSLSSHHPLRHILEQNKYAETS